MSQKKRPTEAQRVRIAKLVKAQPVPVEQLPYTYEFDRIWLTFNHRNVPTIPKVLFWRWICSLRKQGWFKREPETLFG